MSSECVFCEGRESLAVLMHEALASKHCAETNSEQSLIEALVRQSEAPDKAEQEALARFRECNVEDAADEFMKRVYLGQEYAAKIQMLGEYYKFHSDVPRVVEWSVEGILAKHHNARRTFDYKRIKRMLKQEQGMSITSVQDSEELSVEDKKSRYSDMLHHLQEEDLSESNVLKQLCKQIDQALPKTKRDPPPRFRGSFQTEKFFQNYLLGEENRARDKIRQERKKGKAPIARNQAQSQQAQQRASGIQSLLRKIRGKQQKFVYNTNIRIEIRNAKFYSNGEPRKETIFSKLNFISGQEPSHKGISEVYKSSRRTEDRSKSRQHRLRTGDSKEIPRSKERLNYQVEKALFPFKEAIVGTSKQRLSPRSNHRLASTSKQKLNYGLQYSSKDKINCPLRSNYPSKQRISVSKKSLIKQEGITVNKVGEEKLSTIGVTSRKSSRDYQGLRTGTQCNSLKRIIAPNDRLSSRKRSTTMTNLHSKSQKKIFNVYARTVKGDMSQPKQLIPRSKILSIKELLNRKLAFEKY